MQQESVAIEEKSAQIAADKEAKKQAKAEKIIADRKRETNLRNESSNGAAINADSNAVQVGSERARALEILIVREAIDADEVDIILGDGSPKKKRKYHSIRPHNWRIIAQYYIDNGFTHLRSNFGEELHTYTDKALKLNLKRAWVPDLNNKITDETLLANLVESSIFD